MHIMSDEQYNRLMAMKAYMEDPAPMPLLYWVCPECGISLDIGERCECGKWQWGGDTNAQG